MSANEESIFNCRADWNPLDPTTVRRMEVTFEISANGEVTHVKVPSSTIKDRALLGCFTGTAPRAPGSPLTAPTVA